jgi:hypothetical protein
MSFLLRGLQIPFMICSANEIDIQFQYRYCHQVSLALFLNSLHSLISNPHCLPSDYLSA